MSSYLIAPPTILAVSVADMKLFLRVDHSADDGLISVLIQTATQEAEHRTRRSIMQQTWKVTLDSFPSSVELLYGPVVSIASVVYTDMNQADITLTPDNYYLDNASSQGSGWLTPAYGKSWPVTLPTINAVRISYVCGAAAPALTPTVFSTWIQLRVAQLYDHRGAEVSPLGNTALLDRWTLHQF
jgi:uncharacterized phiE125 gp8 family phage protein